MKHDETPNGSVFGGYGFFSYSAAQNNPSAGNTRPTAPQSSNASSLRLRLLPLGASSLLARWKRG